MATHVTHGGAVSSHPGQGQGQGQGHPPPFAQLPTPADVVEAAIALDAFVAITIADVVEATGALDAFVADVDAGGAAIDADVVAAATALDILDAVSDIAADAIEAASALDGFEAVAVLAAAIDEPASAVEALDAVANVTAVVVEAAAALDELDAAVGAQVLFGTVDEPVSALDQLDAAVEAAEIPAVGGGGGVVRPQRPFPVEGEGFGILPPLWGEAHGVVETVGAGAGTLPDFAAEVAASVGVAGRSEAQFLIRAAALGVRGQTGAAVAVLKGLSVASHGVVGARGSGSGMIMKFEATATGQHDDDEAAVMAFLLAA